jgi:LemA protein
MKKTWIIIIAVLALLVLSIGGSYNSLVNMNESVNSYWSKVDVQLQRRADLIPNLVSTVKGYAQHEQQIFTEVAEARSRLIGAQGAAEKATANDQLSGALSRLLAISESYPNLKADANFRQLQDELAGTENRLAVARMDYNNSVQTYNAKIKSFPTVIWARILGFAPRDYFKAEAGTSQVPSVNFNQ